MKIKISYYLIGKKFLNSIEFLDESMDEWTKYSPRNNCSKSASPLPSSDAVYDYNDCDFLDGSSTNGVI